jgi:hypothetical protein
MGNELLPTDPRFWQTDEGARGEACGDPEPPFWTDADIISSYSRAQAIEDGVLVDLTDPSFTFRPNLQILKEVGIKYPVAMTIAAFSRTVQALDEPLPPCQDLSGRLWDVLYMFKLAAKRGGELLYFKVSVRNWVRIKGKRINRACQETITLKAVCGPGDTPEPVITIMLPEED